MSLPAGWTHKAQGQAPPPLFQGLPPLLQEGGWTAGQHNPNVWAGHRARLQKMGWVFLGEDGVGTKTALRPALPALSLSAGLVDSKNSRNLRKVYLPRRNNLLARFTISKYLGTCYMELYFHS